VQASDVKARGLAPARPSWRDAGSDCGRCISWMGRR